MEEIHEKAKQQRLHLFASDLLETVNKILNLPEPSKDEIDGVIRTINNCTELEGGKEQEQEKGKGFGLHWRPSDLFTTDLIITPMEENALHVSVDRVVLDQKKQPRINFSKEIGEVTSVEMGDGVITFKGKKPDEFISVNEFGQVQTKEGGDYR